MNYPQTWGQRKREAERLENRENMAKGIVWAVLIFIMCIALTK